VEGTNNIKLTFDKIDAVNPRAQFNCIFCLQADDTYAVVSCEPMISDVKVSARLFVGILIDNSKSCFVAYSKYASAVHISEISLQ
jgi:hypothetical protein